MLEPEPDDEDILNETVDVNIQLAAMEKANKIISKYKNKEYKLANPNSTRSWLMGTIKEIIDAADRTILPHKYVFANNREAAKHNTKILKRTKYDLTLALERCKGTVMEPGSEFRRTAELKPLFHHHEHWEKMSEIIATGLDYPLNDLPDKILKDDVTAMIARGNHKSATAP